MNKWKNKDFYAELGLSGGASADEIKKAFRTIAKENHPDKNNGDITKAEKFRRASEAWEVLSNPEKRFQYDAMAGDTRRRFDDFYNNVVRPNPARPTIANIINIANVKFAKTSSTDNASSYYFIPKPGKNLDDLEKVLQQMNIPFKHH
jgi:DnaJ-class molecular chaperone